MGLVPTQVRVSVGKRSIPDKAPGLRLTRIIYYGGNSLTSPRGLCAGRVPCALRLTGTARAKVCGLGGHIRGTESDALCRRRCRPTPMLVFEIVEPAAPKRGARSLQG